MKIYEIGTGYTPIPAQMGAATEIVVEEITRSFLKNGEVVEIIDIQAPERAKTDLPISEVKVPVVFTKTDVSLGIMHKLKRVVYSICLAKHLKKILKKSAEKVVLHFHNQYNLFFFLKLVPAKLRKKATIAYTVHSYIWHGAWDEISADIHKRYFQELYCLKHADCVFVLNANTRKTIAEHTDADPERVYLIDNGVNTDVYYPVSTEEKNAIKERYSLTGKTVFVQIGSVCERKNQLTSIKLLLPVLKENKNIVFCYAGGVISQEYQSDIAAFAEKHGIQNQILYVGELKPGKQINELYNISEAMIFPSKAEGFSLVIVEAMSAGTPVVIHNSLQFELAESCLRFANRDDFLEKLNSEVLESHNCGQWSQRVRQVITERYSWHKIAADYKAVFEEKSDTPCI